MEKKDLVIEESSIKDLVIPALSVEESSINDLSDELSNLSFSLKKNSHITIKKIIFISVDINTDIIDDIIKLMDKHILEDKFLNKEFHITLAYKPTEEERYSIPDEGTECKIYIEGYGYSNDAVACKVDKILTNTDKNVNYFLKDDGVLHITIALAENIKPVDSYLAIKDTYVKFEEIICIKGYIKYNFAYKKKIYKNVVN